MVLMSQQMTKQSQLSFTRFLIDSYAGLTATQNNKQANLVYANTYKTLLINDINTKTAT